MVKLITDNGAMTELIPVDKVMVNTLPLRATLQKYSLVYPDGYSAVFEPPKNSKNGEN